MQLNMVRGSGLNSLGQGCAAKASGFFLPRQEEKDVPLSRRGYQSLALLCAAVGVWACYVILEFFFIALNTAEEGGVSRQLTLASAGLFVVAGVLAFSLPALLPRAAMKSMRWILLGFGLALLIFEVVTMFGSQMVVVRAGQAAAEAQEIHRLQLERSLERADRIAAAATTTASHQGASRFAASRADGSDLLRRVIESEETNRKRLDELVRLQTEEKQALANVFGESGAIWWALARAMLFSTTNLVMFAAAGNFLRMARNVPLMRQYSSALPVGAISPKGGARMNAALFPSQWNRLAAPVQARACSSDPAVPVAAQRQAVQAGGQDQSEDSGLAAVDLARSRFSEALPRIAQIQEGDHTGVINFPSSRMDTGVGDFDGHRYRLVREAVLNRRIGTTVRDIKAVFKGSNETIRGYQARMVEEGILVRVGPGPTAGYRLHPCHSTAETGLPAAAGR